MVRLVLLVATALTVGVLHGSILAAPAVVAGVYGARYAVGALRQAVTLLTKQLTRGDRKWTTPGQNRVTLGPVHSASSRPRSAPAWSWSPSLPSRS